MSATAHQTLPTQDDLPYDDGEPMETARHRMQMELLIHSLEPWLVQRGDGYAGGNMFVYYSPDQVRNQDFKGPDFYAVLGVTQQERKSWVVWQEGKGPDVVIELLSESTQQVDKTSKKDIYQNRLKVSDYYWYDPFNPEDWAGFSLQGGVYRPLQPDAQQRLYSPALGLWLTRWYGRFSGVETTWLRWAYPSGELIPTSEETAFLHAEEARVRAERAAQRAETEAQRAKTQAQRAERETQRAEREAQRAQREADARRKAEQQAAKLAARLRALGIDPEQDA